MNANDTLAAGRAAFDNADYDAARSLLQPLAESGEYKAKYLMGVMCEEGKGAPPDAEQAAAWYRKAGGEDARDRLAIMLIRGQLDESKQDTGNVGQWYLAAALRGNVEAQYRLGLFSLDKRAKLLYNPAHGASMLHKAAEQGHALAQYALGELYSKGISHGLFERGPYPTMFSESDNSVPQDFEQAVHWYRQAAEQGLACARQTLGRAYAEGLLGLPRDDALAEEWRRKTATQAGDGGLA